MSARWHFLWALLLTLLAAGGVGLIGNDYYLRILFMMTVYYLCGAGMNILVGFAGQKSLGQAGLFAAGAYGVALLTTLTSINPWTALLLSMLISGVCGVLIALPGPLFASLTEVDNVLQDSETATLTNSLRAMFSMLKCSPQMDK